MRRIAVVLALAWFTACWHVPVAHAAEKPVSYRRVLERTAGMVESERAYGLVNRHGLDLVNVMWEDTGRYYGSSVGPNISDVTIQVQERYEVKGKTRTRLYLMPVIRYPNFSDKTGDVPIDRIELLVGNERGEDLKPVNLRDFLGDLRRYLHAPDSWKGEQTSLLAKRDKHVLVSAQAAFLPIPAGGDATFNPVIFNYQSSKKNPAVLTILATREGTSVTIIDNQRDAFDAGGVWGQRLFFNQNGQRASLTGKRQTDFLAETPKTLGAKPVSPSLGAEAGLNMVMIIQVPLKHRAPRHHVGLGALGAVSKLDDGFSGGSASRQMRSDVENAVIGHGELEGAFTEIAGLPIERDARFPVRVTVQFYKATSNGVLASADVAAIKAQVKRVYKEADYVGSLVTQGYTGRPTEWEGDHREPADFWQVFWQHFQADTGMSPEETMRLLEERVTTGWHTGVGPSRNSTTRLVCLPEPLLSL
jgi:hypothetical protein